MRYGRELRRQLHSGEGREDCLAGGRVSGLARVGEIVGISAGTG